jgi:copper oxidase (laccase) domain-containing protein
MSAVILRATALSLASTAVIVAADLFLRAHGGWRGMIRAICGFVGRCCRVFSRAVDLGVWLRHQAGRRIYDVAEDLVLVLPPRNGKSSYLADRILGQPGPTSADDTRPDPPELGEAGGES